MHILNYIVTVFLCTAAVILYLYADNKNKINLWISATAFVPVLRTISYFMLFDLMPFIRINHPEKTILLDFTNFLLNLFNLESFLFYPYCLLMYCINYSEVFESKYVITKRILSIGFFIPIVFITAISPLDYYSSVASLPPRIDIIIPWALCCFILANFLIIYSFLHSKTSLEKRQRFLVCLLIIPLSFVTSYTSYSSYYAAMNIWKLSIMDLWRISCIIIFITLLMFVIFAIRYGVMGLRLKVQLNRLDDKIKTSFSGASSLNHSLKNELTNINLCNKMINRAIESSSDHELIHQLKSKLEIIQNSVDSMLEITSKMHEQTKEIIISESMCNMSELLDRALESVSTLLEEKNISVLRNINCTVHLLCDPVHIHEVIVNILRNSIEATKEKGEINIKILKFKRYISLVIEDNGSGISRENLKYVFEPFYSTKNTKLSFGLGLSYCFNVMRKHDGTLEIRSEEGKGTAVFLGFSRKKIVKVTDNTAFTNNMETTPSKVYYFTNNNM